jgi:hypothetical protein
MILTFYKPTRVHKAREPKKPVQAAQAAVLSEVFDACLGSGQNSFTSEALFNRLVIELWRRRALRCLSLDRREFASRLEQRGWNYNPRTHLWSKAGYPQSKLSELTLFDR